jgi:hypothetical protein
VVRRRRRLRHLAGGLVAGIFQNEFTKGSVHVTRERRLVIDLPRFMDFEDNYYPTASHLNSFRTAAKVARRVKYLHFDKIEKISPSAALVLASEVDRWNQRTQHRLRASVNTWNEEIKRLLSQMGYFNLLNLEKPVGVLESSTVSFLPFKRGDLNNGTSATLAKELRIEIESLVGFEIERHLLYEGLSEAITNVSQHAYPEAHTYMVRQWWLSASYDRTSRELRVVFFDQGAGIPATLPNWRFFERIKAMLNVTTDSDKIAAAMEVGRSASGEEHRGKGLQNFMHFAERYRPSSLSIYSLRGMYRRKWLRQEDTNVVQTERKDFTVSVGGTLIEWAVRL